MDPAAVVIVIYLLAMLVIGAWGLRMKGLEDFHLAGRGIKLILLTGTFCASIIGASATLGMAGLGFSNGLPGAWWMLSGTIGLLVLATFFAEKVRATGCYTLPELVGSFYGERARFVASVLIVISWVGVIAVQIVASGKVLGAVFGGNETIFMAACTAVFVLYTVHGGQSSVIRTDLIQLMIILAGMSVLFFRAFQAVGPGILSSQSFPTSAEMGGWDAVSMLLVVGSAYLVGPDMYSRLLSAYSPKEAKVSAAIAAVVLIPLAFLITSLGIFARSLYPAASPEQAIPVLLTGLLSPGSEGLVAAALLAAFMSSADTSLMTATSILTMDIYRKASPGSSEKKLMAISRLLVLIIGSLALALAVSMPGIIKTLLIAYAVFTSGLLLPVIAGFYRYRLGLTPSGALAALVGGGAAAIFLGQKYPLLGMAVSAAFLFGVSWLERLYREQKCLDAIL
ncbi:MAG: sodium:solute symporter family protein [Methanothrix sp.]|nr:sodium:solute symporter family protein [Methanothrix sp.]